MLIICPIMIVRRDKAHHCGRHAIFHNIAIWVCYHMPMFRTNYKCHQQCNTKIQSPLLIMKLQIRWPNPLHQSDTLFNNPIPWSEFCLSQNSCINQLWLKSYENCPSQFASWYKSINPTILYNPWFYKLN